MLTVLFYFLFHSTLLSFITGKSSTETTSIATLVHSVSTQITYSSLHKWRALHFLIRIWVDFPPPVGAQVWASRPLLIRTSLAFFPALGMGRSVNDLTHDSDRSQSADQIFIII